MMSLKVHHKMMILKYIIILQAYFLSNLYLLGTQENDLLQ